VRILLLHNAYQHAGGEDVSVAREHDLLAGRGHDVRLHVVSNQAVRNTWDRMRTAAQVPYSVSARRRVASEIQAAQPDIVHVHNFFPLLTPSVYDACRAARRPVVQTLHNYRLLCVNGTFSRGGDVCEDCLRTPVPWPGVLHACYRGSRGGSAAVAAMLTLHRALGTWAEKVDAYVVPTEFARRMFIRGGLPPEKIAVKPHFVDPDPGPGDGAGGYALFVGRLSPEKGVAALLAAWERLGERVPLKIVGDGPLAPDVATATRRGAPVEWLGHQPPDRVRALMKDARVLLFPSLVYETFGMVIAEAYAAGLPVIASEVGSAASLVAHGRSGLLFRRGDPADLAAKVTWLWTHPEERAALSRGARREFQQHYSAEHNYRALMDIYALATWRAQRSKVAEPDAGAAAHERRLHPSP
jgi:glycosyltransferase involved in cell wall biosynthesis